MADTVRQPEDKIWNTKFVRITVINFLLSMGQFMMNTLVPKFADSLGATAAVVGVVSSMFAITALGIRPIAGPAMDYFRKNRMLTLSVGLIVVAFVGYGLSRSVTLIILSRLIHGLGVGVAIPLSMAMASNALPPGKMASGLSIFSLGNALATAVGPSVGLYLTGSLGYNVTFFIVAALLALCLALTLQLKSSTPVKHSRFKIQLNRVIVPEVIVPAVITLFVAVGYSSISYFLALFGGLQGVEDIGLYFTSYAVCLLVSRPISGKIADRYGLDKTIIPGFVLFAASFVLISFCKTLPMFLLAGAVSAFGYGICVPLIMTLCMQLVPPNQRGAASNTNFIGMDSGYLIGPPLAGLVVTAVENSTGSEAVGYAVMYRGMVAPIAVALVIFFIYRKKLLARLKSMEEQ
jgi:MFS family permease